MKHTIKTRFTNEIIFEAEAESLRDAVEEAVSKNISLEGAYLGRANLENANLSGTDLSAPI